MEYKSNNGVYARAPRSLISSLRHIHILHCQQVLLPQFNNLPHPTFMTIIIPFFGGRPDFQSVLRRSSVSFLVYTLSTPTTRHHVRKGSEISKNANGPWATTKKKATHDILIYYTRNNYPAAPTTSSPSPSASASPSPSTSMSSSPSASAECSKYIGSRTSASASARSSASSWLGGTCATRTRAHLSRKRSIG
jgi:hypothetical protein